MSPECSYWSDCGVRGGGCCGLSRFGGRPSHGICAGCVGRGENRVLGAGDGVAAVMNATGLGQVAKKAIQAATGKPCNCTGRQLAMNRFLPCRKRAG